jgi:hypothetical protein
MFCPPTLNRVSQDNAARKRDQGLAAFLLSDKSRMLIAVKK